MAAMSRRVNIRQILADPVLGRELRIRVVMTAQHMEGIDTTYEQAARAVDKVLAEKAAGLLPRHARGAR